MFISGLIDIEDLECRRILIKFKIATFRAKIYCRLATLAELMHTNFIVPEYADKKPELDITLNKISSFFSKKFCQPWRQKLQSTEKDTNIIYSEKSNPRRSSGFGPPELFVLVSNALYSFVISPTTLAKFFFSSSISLFAFSALFTASQ
jgi:hypothetical protein